MPEWKQFSFTKVGRKWSESQSSLSVLKSEVNRRDLQPQATPSLQNVTNSSMLPQVIVINGPDGNNRTQYGKTIDALTTYF